MLDITTLTRGQPIFYLSTVTKKYERGTVVAIQEQEGKVRVRRSGGGTTGMLAKTLCLSSEAPARVSSDANGRQTPVLVTRAPSAPRLQPIIPSPAPAGSEPRAYQKAVVTTTPELFVHEDVDKRENRLNLALFALLNIPILRRHLLATMGIPDGCVIHPPKSARNGLRPDFVVLNPDESTRAWIEMELGGENVTQLGAYRNAFKEQILSVVGLASSRGSATTTSFEELGDAIKPDLLHLDPQQCVHAQLFLTLVHEWAHPPISNSGLIPVDEKILGQPLVQALVKELGDVLQSEKPEPGETAQLATRAQVGWTVRVYSANAKGGSVVVLYDLSPGRGVIQVPSYDWLESYLPERTAARADYADFLKTLGTDIRAITKSKRGQIKEAKLVKEADRLAGHVRALAGVDL